MAMVASAGLPVSLVKRNTPSPLVGEIQRAVYEMQLDNRVRTLEEAKAAARELLEGRRAEPDESGGDGGRL